MVWMCDVVTNEIKRIEKDGQFIKQESCNKDCSISPTKNKKQTKDLKTRLRLKLQTPNAQFLLNNRSFCSKTGKQKVRRRLV